MSFPQGGPLRHLRRYLSFRLVSCRFLKEEPAPMKMRPRSRPVAVILRSDFQDGGHEAGHVGPGDSSVVVCTK